MERAVSDGLMLMPQLLADHLEPPSAETYFFSYEVSRSLLETRRRSGPKYEPRERSILDLI